MNQQSKAVNTKAAVYVRGSTPSFSNQKRSLTKYAQGEGWSYRVYADPGLSGAAVTGRPGIQRLLAHIKAGKIQVVLVTDFDRLSRNTKDLVSILDLFDKKDVKLITLGQETNGEVNHLPALGHLPLNNPMWSDFLSHYMSEFEKAMRRERNKQQRRLQM